MACSYDWCTIISSDMQIGMISSILASAITALMLIFYRKFDNKLKYSKASGNYLGYEPDKADPRQLKPEPLSEAAIVYENENRLKITLTHDKGKRTWDGIITMDNEHYGSVAWSYRNQIEFGFKKCIMSNDYKKVMLIEEAPPKHEGEIRYGREILVRKE